MKPRVSVLLSVYNGEAYLAEAVESILGQTLADLELIVIDDASTDGTWGVVSRYQQADKRVRPLRNKKNLGLAASLNRCMDAACGDYLARQDADDVSLAQRLETQAGFLDAHPETVLLGSAVRPIDQNGSSLGPPDRHPAGDPAIRTKMLLFNAFHHSSVMMRADTLRGCGLSYNGELAYAQDYDLWSRLLKHGRGANLNEPLVLFRHHPGQASKASWGRQQRIADRIALRNLGGAGLGGMFSPEDVALMRRATVAGLDLTPAQRVRQFQCLRRLFAQVSRGPAGTDPDWQKAKSAIWANHRRAALRQPKDRAALRVLCGLLLADPAGCLNDLALLAGFKRGAD